MPNDTNAGTVTEQDMLNLVTRLDTWGQTLPRQEQVALAFLLERAAAADDTEGHIIIVSGAPASARLGLTAGYTGGTIWRQQVLDLRQRLGQMALPGA
jgi:hypothetical protein